MQPGHVGGHRVGGKSWLWAAAAPRKKPGGAAGLGVLPAAQNEPLLLLAEPLRLGWQGAAADFLPPFQQLKVPAAINLPSQSRAGSLPRSQVRFVGSGRA